MRRGFTSVGDHDTLKPRGTERERQGLLGDSSASVCPIQYQYQANSGTSG